MCITMAPNLNFPIWLKEKKRLKSLSSVLWILSKFSLKYKRETSCLISGAPLFWLSDPWCYSVKTFRKWLSCLCKLYWTDRFKIRLLIWFLFIVLFYMGIKFWHVCAMRLFAMTCRLFSLYKVKHLPRFSHCSFSGELRSPDHHHQSA